MKPNETDVTGARGQGAANAGRITPRDLEGMRRRHGGQPLACRSCGWQGQAGECEVVPVHRALGAYALPGAAWRGPMRELCPVCGDEALEPARWCPECCGWTCLCGDEGQEDKEEPPGL